MKTRLFIQVFVFTGMPLWGVLSLGQGMAGSQEAALAGRNTGDEEESALLERLEGYMRENNPLASQNTEDLVEKLAAIGSTNVVQFFLDNITWRSPFFNNMPSINTSGTVGGELRMRPMGNALFLRIKDLPLPQCVDALTGSEEGTLKALMIECVAKLRHGDSFLREIERLAETSPDPGRWEAMKVRLEKNAPLWLPKPRPPAAAEEAGRAAGNEGEAAAGSPGGGAGTGGPVVDGGASGRAGDTTAQDKQPPTAVLLLCALLALCSGAVFHFARRKGKL